MDTGHPFDRPHEADRTPDAYQPADSRTYLAALGERLKGQFDVDLTDDGLVVHHRDRLGAITVTCRRRPDDGGRWWFITACGQPIAEIHNIPDTIVAIHGYLTRDHP